MSSFNLCHFVKLMTSGKAKFSIEKQQKRIKIPSKNKKKNHVSKLFEPSIVFVGRYLLS